MTLVSIECPALSEYIIRIAEEADNGKTHDMQVVYRQAMEHRLTCPLCLAIENGVGLAGGLFTGSKISNNSKLATTANDDESLPDV